MLASELRIGNLLEDDIGNIIAIDKDSLPYIVTKWIKCHHTIPLTEEWLLKFGFECVWSRQGEGSTFKLSDMYLHSHDFVNNFYLVELKGNGIKIKIDSVHQLQNLYFALTGKELEY